MYHIIYPLLSSLQYEKARNIIVQYIELYEHNDNDEESLGFLYNMLGYLMIFESNELQAADYFCQALKCYHTEEVTAETVSIYLNMAVMYQHLRDLETANKYYKMVESYFQKNGEKVKFDTDYRHWYVRYMINYIRFHQLKCDYQGMVTLLLKLEELNRIIQSDLFCQYLIFLRAKIAYLLGEKKLFVSMIEGLLEKESVLFFPELCEDYMEGLEYLVACKQFDLCKTYLMYFDIQIKIQESDARVYRYYYTLASYYRETKQFDLLTSTYIDFYQIIKRRDETIKSVKALTLKTKQRLNKEVLSQKKFKNHLKKIRKESEHDALTSLPNRFLLEKDAPFIFQKAITCKKQFGVIIIDIDYFKEYNDCFGHIAGDHCLKKIAMIILGCSKGQLCLRFGGDEFVVITYDMNETDLKALATRIKEDVMANRIKHATCLKQPYVTVSQGIFVDFPDTKQSYLDYFNMADQALYEGKQKSRNTISIRSNFQ